MNACACVYVCVCPSVQYTRLNKAERGEGFESGAGLQPRAKNGLKVPPSSFLAGSENIIQIFK